MGNQGIHKHARCWQSDSCTVNEEIMKKNTNFSCDSKNMQSGANESAEKQN